MCVSLFTGKSLSAPVSPCLWRHSER